MAPPMPPLAPVTSAFFPARSNIQESRKSGRAHRISGDIGWRADGNAGRTFGDTLEQSRQHLTGAKLKKAINARACHESHGLAPPHGTGDLRDKPAADSIRIGDRTRRDI